MNLSDTGSGSFVGITPVAPVIKTPQPYKPPVSSPQPVTTTPQPYTEPVTGPVAQFTGYIPDDLYATFVANKAKYDELGKPYPVHYIDIGSTRYVVNYSDPYQIVKAYGSDRTREIKLPDRLPTPGDVAAVYTQGADPHQFEVPINQQIDVPVFDKWVTQPYTPAPVIVGKPEPVKRKGGFFTDVPEATVSGGTGGSLGVMMAIVGAMLFGRSMGKRQAKPRRKVRR